MKSFDSRIEFEEIIDCVDMFPGTCITPLATRIKIRLGRYMDEAEAMIVAAHSGGQPVRNVLGSTAISVLL